MGKQVAINTEAQMVMTLREDKYGVLHMVTEPKPSHGLIRKEYIPIGNRFVYPKKWGRKKAGEVFIEHLISEQEKILLDTRTYLDKLNLIKEGINEWESS